MTTKVFFSAVCLTATLFISCGTQKQAVKSAPTAPFGEVYDMPCSIHDSREKFAATGIYKCSSNQKGECHLNAIANAKALIREKYRHAYKGMISDYSSTSGNNRGNDIVTKLERAGDAVIEMVLNDAYEVCTKFSNVQDDGMIECYVAIEIYKDELADKVAKKVANVLTDEEKMKIDFKEDEYRKRMEERMMNFEESKR